jgi:hypothetical protein
MKAQLARQTSLINAREAEMARKRAADDKRHRDAEQSRRERKAQVTAEKKDTAMKRAHEVARKNGEACWGTLPILFRDEKCVAGVLPEHISLGLGTIRPSERETLLASLFVKGAGNLSLLLPVMADREPDVRIDGEPVAVSWSPNKPFVVDVALPTASPSSVVIEVIQLAPKQQERRVMGDAERDEEYRRALRLLKLRVMGDGDVTCTPAYFRSSCHLFPLRDTEPGIATLITGNADRRRFMIGLDGGRVYPLGLAPATELRGMKVTLKLRALKPTPQDRDVEVARWTRSHQFPYLTAQYQHTNKIVDSLSFSKQKCDKLLRGQGPDRFWDLAMGKQTAVVLRFSEEEAGLSFTGWAEKGGAGAQSGQGKVNGVLRDRPVEMS